MARKPTVKKPRKKADDDAFTVDGNWVKLPDGISVDEAVAYATGKKELPIKGAKKAAGKTAAKRKPGRPSKRTPELAAAICAVVASGKSIHDAAQECGYSISCIMDWQAEDKEFSAQLTRAREKCLLVLEDKLVKVAQMEIDGYRDPEITPTGASLLQHGWEHYYKLLQVYNARFRERKSVELTGADGKELVPRCSPAELAAAIRSSEEAFKGIKGQITTDEGEA